jgi:precorrin-4 methylase
VCTWDVGQELLAEAGVVVDKKKMDSTQQSLLSDILSKTETLCVEFNGVDEKFSQDVQKVASYLWSHHKELQAIVHDTTSIHEKSSDGARIKHMESFKSICLALTEQFFNFSQLVRVDVEARCVPGWHDRLARFMQIDLGKHSKKAMVVLKDVSGEHQRFQELVSTFTNVSEFIHKIVMDDIENLLGLDRLLSIDDCCNTMTL